MAAARDLAIGLLVAHAAWLWLYLCGTIVVPPDAERRGIRALLDVVLATGAGVALTALATFALGLAHLISPLGAVCAAASLAGAFTLRGGAPWRGAFWRARLAALGAACTPGALIVYMIALFLAPPVVLPDNGSDATAFYLPQAFEYARDHALSVNPWFRFPWYPNNWVVVIAWPFVFGADRYVQFLNWLAGLLTLLNVYGLVALRSRGDNDHPSVDWIALGAAVTLAAQPIFERFLSLNMIDVPSGYGVLLIATAAAVAVRERSTRVLGALVLCAGFLIGMKVSYVALFPLAALLCFVVLGAAGATRRSAAIALVMLAVCSAPWYLRAFVLTGDPIQPVLNLRVHGSDPKMTRTDMQALSDDLRADNSPLTLLRLPYLMYAENDRRDLRDLGVTLSVLGLPLCALYLAWALLRRKMAPRPILIVAATVLYCYGYWILTSHLQRYSLLFAPAFAAFLGLAAHAAVRRRPTLRLPAVATLLALSIPSPSAFAFDRFMWDYAYTNVSLYYVNRPLWLELRSPAYPQLEDIAHLMRRAHRQGRRVYFVYLGGSAYYADQMGVQELGDLTGPGRFKDFARAIIHDAVGPWLERFKVDVVVVAQSTLDGDPSFAGLDTRLSDLGWRRYPYAYSDWVVFTSPRLPPLVYGEGHPRDLGPVGAGAPPTPPPTLSPSPRPSRGPRP